MFDKYEIQILNLNEKYIFLSVNGVGVSKRWAHGSSKYHTYLGPPEKIFEPI